MGWCTLYSGCHIWDWGGAFCILDGLNGIVDNKFDFGGHFTFGGGVFGDLDDIFGILYGDYAIGDDYLVFELIYFVFICAFGMLGNIFDIWEHPCLHFGCYVLFF